MSEQMVGKCPNILEMSEKMAGKRRTVLGNVREAGWEMSEQFGKCLRRWLEFGIAIF